MQVNSIILAISKYFQAK